MTYNFGQMKPIANVGDLVRCKGYGNRLFQVEAYTHEIAIDSENEIEDIYYDMTDVLTHDYTLGNQADIYVISKAEEADDYLRQYKSNNTESQAIKNIPLDFLTKYTRGADKVSKGAYERKPTPRELSSQESERRNQERNNKSEQADKLLDEMRDYQCLIAMFGDMEGGYAAEIDGIKAELTELTRKE